MTLPPWPADRPLRAWQRAAAAAVVAHPGERFLASATPAAGKTTFGLHVAHAMLAAGRVARVAVVAPTTHIARQWAADAARYGLDLEPNRPNAGGPGAARPPRRRRDLPDGRGRARPCTGAAARTAPTLLIADEPHHMGDDAAWGRSARGGLRRARASGCCCRARRSARTPRRSLGDATTPTASPRPTSPTATRTRCSTASAGPSPSTSTTATWPGCRDGRRRAADFTVGLPARRGGAPPAHRAGPRRRLDRPRPARRRPAPRAAPRRRPSGRRRARGGRRQGARRGARRAARRASPASGPRSSPATRRTPARIARFAAGTGSWLVSVLMVSEGVDIPRLRVGVYATSARTELFFRQVVGRFIRRTPAPRADEPRLPARRPDAASGSRAQVEEERRHALALEPAGRAARGAGRAGPLRAGRRVPRAVVERARRGGDAADDPAGGDAVAVRGRPAALAGPGRVHRGARGADARAVAAGARRPRTSGASGCAPSAARWSPPSSRLTGEPHRAIHARVNRETGARVGHRRLGRAARAAATRCSSARPPAGADPTPHLAGTRTKRSCGLCEGPDNQG